MVDMLNDVYWVVLDCRRGCGYKLPFLWGAAMSRENNFDLLRLTAAIAVLVSHCYPLSGHAEPFQPFLGYGTLGNVAVAVFFSISGFLVTQSVQRHSTSVYLASRALRIFPALGVVLLFDVFVVGPIFTTLPIREYFDSRFFWAHLRSFFLFSLDTRLPGAFAAAPFPDYANGSLWTLPYEFFLYLLLPIAVALGLLGRKANLLLAITAVAGLVLERLGCFGLSYEHQGPEIVRSVYLYNFLELSAFFFVASSLWVYRDDIPLTLGGVFVLFALAYAGRQHMIVGYIAYALLVPYATLYLALNARSVLSLSRVGDLSYGIYIFAFPVQQSIVALFSNSISAGLLTALALPIVLLLAYGSFWLIEKPALSLKALMSRSLTRVRPFVIGGASEANLEARCTGDDEGSSERRTVSGGLAIWR
jgi:peptidoglycan/LPS O-acetylase OafA/YrhL